MTAWMNMYRALYTNIDQNKQFRAKGKLPMPVLAIGGQKALAGSVADQWRAYATHVEGRVIRGSGHWITEEKPHELTRMLRQFLR
ncbi:alpha/beta fold hydrolase [Streptomyces sp. Inha503]|uniref:alpha/beta fold hydrolase n=1 Tax=Streptomyces sp. Inha503 TaxID=3383314 RepID=UPI0039A1079D